MHNVVLNTTHPMAAVMPTPYMGFDKDGLYLGVRNPVGAYVSIPLTEEEMKNILVFTSVALTIKQLKLHYRDRVEWSVIYKYVIKPDQYILVVINHGSPLTTDSYADCVVLYGHNYPALVGKMERLLMQSLVEWIPVAQMDPMRYAGGNTDEDA